MTATPTKVYIVWGSTGEYSDHTEWLVAAYLSEASAMQRVADCDRVAKEVFPNRYDNPPPANPYDPDMRIDYTGTNYGIQEVDLVDAP